MTKPLWKSLDEAWWSLVNTEEPHCNPPARDQAACVIRAVRDWLVPEETEFDDGLFRELDASDHDEVLGGFEERQRLRAILTAEAELAERGGQ